MIEDDDQMLKEFFTEIEDSFYLEIRLMHDLETTEQRVLHLLSQGGPSDFEEAAEELLALANRIESLSS